VLNNLMFGVSSLALPAYFQKIALSGEEITSNVAVEQTINHIAAIAVPVLGGAIWELLGFQALFLFGAAIVVIILLMTQFMGIPLPDMHGTSDSPVKSGKQDNKREAE
jgi:MFS family permease